MGVVGRLPRGAAIVRFEHAQARTRISAIYLAPVPAHACIDHLRIRARKSQSLESVPVRVDASNVGVAKYNPPVEPRFGREPQPAKHFVGEQNPPGIPGIGRHRIPFRHGPVDREPRTHIGGHVMQSRPCRAAIVAAEGTRAANGVDPPRI